MDKHKLNQLYKSWASLGGLVGFITTIFFFGFGDGPRDSSTLLIAGLKGFLGGGIGAGIFHGLAAVIFEQKFATKIMYLIIIILLSAVAFVLVYKFSPDFHSFSNQEPKLQRYNLF